MQHTPTRLIFESVLLPDGWAGEVLVEIDADGSFCSVEAGGESDTDHVSRISGCVLPGIPNCHSHAHQRAMAGLGEKAGLSADGKQKLTDSFWTWREVMYHYLERIEPHHLNAISQQLYLEMLKAGYTSVGEFQYLHHDSSGKHYSNPAEMTLQCAQAARQVGIGFTALPVLYQYGGFGSQPALDGQKRFINNADQFCNLVGKTVAELQNDADCAVGIAPHSLRAIDQQLLARVIEQIPPDTLAAIHLHVAEQTKEVDDCIAWSGERPVQWLMNRFEVNQHWCLIHATHMDDEETVRMAASGAIAGLCPTTEANLGDGFFNLLQYVENRGRWAIGSDSHISISAVEELRWLEYGQRLLYRQRNVMAEPGQPHTGTALLTAAIDGGARACGRAIGRIEKGCRADFIVLDNNHPRLYGRKQDAVLDSWLFSGNENAVSEVFVGGKKVIVQGHHKDEVEIHAAYKQAIDQLAG